MQLHADACRWEEDGAKMRFLASRTLRMATWQFFGVITSATAISLTFGGFALSRVFHRHRKFLKQAVAIAPQKEVDS